MEQNFSPDQTETAIIPQAEINPFCPPPQETDEQLLNVSRYIHLNPYSSYVVKSLKELTSYPYSSLPEYLGKTKEEYCYKELVLGNFTSRKDYQKFIFHQADYQRSLEEIKHLQLEKKPEV